MKARKFRNIIPELFLILIMVSIIGFLFLFNDIVKFIGIAELENTFHFQNRVESNRDFIGMVAKYKLHKKLYENKISQHDFNLKEVKTSYFLSLKDRESTVGVKKYKKISPPALFLINAFRTVMGLPKIHLDKAPPSSGYLDVAYYFERNKSYKKALQIYDKAMVRISRNDLQYPIILLHQGFCNSIIGNYALAKGKYSLVIARYKNQKIAETASVLLSYISGFEEEIKRIKSSEADSIEKSEKLFELIAYEEALKTLENVKPANREEAEKISFYKARSHEELGNTKESVELYQRIIDTNPSSEFSRLSNRRMLSISTTSVTDAKKLQQIAEENNLKVKDPDFDTFKEAVIKVNTLQPPETLEEIKEKSDLEDELLLLVDETIVVEAREKMEIELAIGESRAHVLLYPPDFPARSEPDSTSDSAEKQPGEAVTIDGQILTADDVTTDVSVPQVDPEKEQLLAAKNKLEVDKQWLLRQKYLLEKRINRMKGQNKEQIKTLQKEQEELKNKLDQMEKIKKSLEGQLMSVQTESETDRELVQKLSEAEESKTQLEAELEKLRSELEERQTEEQSAVNSDLEEKLTRMEEDKKKLESELAVLKEQIETEDNGKKRNTTETITTKDQFKRIISKFTYQWDAEGERKVTGYSLYYYLRDGKLHQIMNYNGDNNLLSYYIIEYDKDGKQTRIILYDPDGKVIKYQ